MSIPVEPAAEATAADLETSPPSHDPSQASERESSQGRERQQQVKVERAVAQLGGFLVDWIDTQRLRTGVPGVQVAIRQGERLLASFACGWADQPAEVPLTTHHAFRIASHSKTFTATAIMQLAETGRLRLDDRLADWVPELDDAPAGQVTIRELLSHQGGIVRDGDDANFWQLARRFNDRDELVAELQRDLVFAPQTHFHYTNIGYSALGLVIESVTGRRWHEVITDLAEPLTDLVEGPLVFGPELGHGDAEVEWASGHALPVVRRGEQQTAPTHLDQAPVIAPVDTVAEGAATGCWANAEATTAWLSAHALGTDLLLSDSSKRLMQRRESTIVDAGQTRWYGLGWIMRAIGDRHVIGHSGGFPGHITQTWGDPATGLSVSVLTNRNGSNASEWATVIIKLIDFVIDRSEGAGISSPTRSDEAPDASSTSLDGRFCSLWGATHLVGLGEDSAGAQVALQLSSEAADPTAGAVLLTEEVADDQNSDIWLAESKDGFSSYGERLTVTRGSDGQIEAITTTGITAWRPAKFERRLPGLLAGEALHPRL